MNDEVPPTETAEHKDVSSVLDDLSCIGCGYNLRGLDRKGNCPECGSSIERSVLAQHGITKRELASLAFRVAALSVSLSMLDGGLWVYVDDYFNTIIFKALSLGFTTLALVGVWWKADWMARVAIRYDGPVMTGKSISTSQVLKMAVVILGLFFITSAISDIVWIIDLEISSPIYSISKSRIFECVADCLIGVFFVFLPMPITKLLMWTTGEKYRRLN